jgi:hypothetical protein
LCHCFLCVIFFNVIFCVSVQQKKKQTFIGWSWVCIVALTTAESVFWRNVVSDNDSFQLAFFNAGGWDMAVFIFHI